MTRPPIVVVLGHVDHGKSSLLEAIRADFQITSKEAGGITQHIGAYVAEVPGGRTITFIDTPGHEAFSAMRSRGTHIADIAVLVVAADAGVQQQTKEAIEIIQAAKIPMVVAANKIDNPEADIEKVKRQLSECNVFVESFGGEVPCVATSALQKQGIRELLETILLVADIADLRSSPEKLARGAVIETSLDSKRGNCATLLVQDGTLHVSDIVGTKSAWGKAKILEGFHKQPLEHVLPSFPAVMIGFQEHPFVGEEFQVFDTEEHAKAFLSPSSVKETRQGVLAEHIFPIVLKADTAGSLEALEQMLSMLAHDDVSVKIVEANVGDIGEGDVRLAQSTNASIMGFRVRAESGVKAFAQRENIRIETFEVIYDLLMRARELLEKTQTRDPVSRNLASIRILGIFFQERDRQILGGRVLEGEIKKGAHAEVLRNGNIAGKGRVLNVQKDKKDADVVVRGDECGLLFVGNVQVQAQDILQFSIPDSAAIS